MIIISGRLKVEIPSENEAAELGPGEGFHARSNVKHKVTAVEDTIVISCKDVVDGIGHKVAPEEKDQLERLGKV
jgi:quercetin dioxygenase-like cupin family protein